MLHKLRVLNRNSFYCTYCWEGLVYFETILYCSLFQIHHLYFTVDTIMLCLISIVIIFLYSWIVKLIIANKSRNPQSSLHSQNIEIRLSIVGLSLSLCFILMAVRSIWKKGMNDQLLTFDWQIAYTYAIFALFNLSNPYLLLACSGALREKLCSLLCCKKRLNTTNNKGPYVQMLNMGKLEDTSL